MALSEICLNGHFIGLLMGGGVEEKYILLYCYLNQIK